eukprot:UN20109
MVVVNFTFLLSLISSDCDERFNPVDFVNIEGGSLAMRSSLFGSMEPVDGLGDFSFVLVPLFSTSYNIVDAGAFEVLLYL